MKEVNSKPTVILLHKLASSPAFALTVEPRFHEERRDWENWIVRRDCSLFLPTRGPVFRVGGGGKIFKINEKGGVF